MPGYKTRLATRRAGKNFEFGGIPRVRRHACDETCEHYRSPEEKALGEKVRALLKAELPPGTKAVTGREARALRLDYDVRIVCDGSDPLMAYDCCLKPKHAGECFDPWKMVNFTPRSG